jgi:hypothetical protein
MNLPFQQFDLGHRRRGEVIRVNLSAGANVFLMDSSNFSAFKRSANFRFHGDLFNELPMTL